MSKFIDMAVLAVIVFAVVMFFAGYTGGMYIGCGIAAFLMVIQDVVDRREYFAQRFKSLQMRRKERVKISL